MLRWVDTWRCDNCKVPARANIRGTNSCWNSAGSWEGGVPPGWICAGGREGIRQERGASL